MCCIRECSSAVNSAAGNVGAIGSPTAIDTGTFGRHIFLGWSLVQMRWAPHTMCGTIGTPAAIAIRAAPDLNPLISKLRLMVASGYTPTSSPSLSRSQASWKDAAPFARSTGMCRNRRISGPVTAWSNTSCLAMKRTLRPSPCR